MEQGRTFWANYNSLVASYVQSNKGYQEATRDPILLLLVGCTVTQLLVLRCATTFGRP